MKKFQFELSHPVKGTRSLIVCAKKKSIARKHVCVNCWSWKVDNGIEVTEHTMKDYLKKEAWDISY